MTAISTSEAVALAQAVIDDQVNCRWSDVAQRFDETMRVELTEKELAKGWTRHMKRARTYKGHGDTTVVRRGDLTRTSTPLAFERGDFVARIVFRDDRSIAGLYILNANAVSDD